MVRRLHSERARLQGPWRGNPGHIGWGTAARIGDGHRLARRYAEEAQNHILRGGGVKLLLRQQLHHGPVDADVQEGLTFRIESGGPRLDPVVVVVTHEAAGEHARRACRVIVRSGATGCATQRRSAVFT